jgi:hypothetical protein
VDETSRKYRQATLDGADGARSIKKGSFKLPIIGESAA